MAERPARLGQRLPGCQSPPRYEGIIDYIKQAGPG